MSTVLLALLVSAVIVIAVRRHARARVHGPLSHGRGGWTSGHDRLD